MDIDEHKAPQWLVVRFLETSSGLGMRPGWYVVRTCPCHWGTRVTLPYPTKERAERVRRVLLGELKTRTLPKLTWDHSRGPVAAPAPAEGQVWRDRHQRNDRPSRGDRHFRIERIWGDKLIIRRVERQNDLTWATPAWARAREMRADRIARANEFAFVEGPSAGYSAAPIWPWHDSGEAPPTSGTPAQPDCEAQDRHDSGSAEPD